MMENPKTNFAFFELIIIDSVINLIFVFTLFVAILSPAHHPYTIGISAVFGALTLPFAPFFGRLLNFLRSHENLKAAAILKIDPSADVWTFLSVSERGYAWIFRIISGVIMVFSLYHLFSYLFT
jgi:hypothetical protein